MLLRRMSAAVIGLVLSGFAVLLLSARYPQSGPILLSFSRGHGVHLGDLFVVAGWALAMAALGALTVRRGVSDHG
jgi:cell division protein FtsX